MEKGIPRGKDDLEEDLELSINEILVKLYKSDEDLPLKTRVMRPEGLTAFKSLADFLERKRYFGGVAKIMQNHYKTFLELMVSWEGKGREEAVRIIAGILDKETIRMTIGERMTTNLAKK